jgi:hypothetical protein
MYGQLQACVDWVQELVHQNGCVGETHGNGQEDCWISELVFRRRFQCEPWLGGPLPATDAPQRCSQGGIAILVYQRGGLHCVLPVGSRPTPVGMRTLRASAAFIAVLLAAGGAACVDAKSSSSRRRASRSSWHPFEEPPQDAVSLGRLRHHSGRMIDQQDKVGSLGCCNNATVAFALFGGFKVSTM